MTTNSHELSTDIKQKVKYLPAISKIEYPRNSWDNRNKMLKNFKSTVNRLQ